MTAERAIGVLDKLKRGSVATLHSRSGIEALEMAIKALEQQRWIPVSERLSEDSRDVIVTTRSGTVGVGSCLDSGDDYWVQWYSGGGIAVDVIAWQSLPEPYKGDE